MPKVDFQYSPKRGGKTVSMAPRYAETLRKLGHGTYAGAPEGYQTRMLTAAGPAPVAEEPLVSEAIAEFAKEHGVNIEQVVGTGKDGRIKKSDVEAVIAAQDLA